MRELSLSMISKKRMSLRISKLIQFAFHNYHLRKNLNFEEITKKHKVIAVLPFVSVLSLKKRQERKTSESEKNTLKTTYRYQAQRDFRTNFSSWKIKKGLEIELQPIDKTNELLKEHKIDLDSLEHIDKVELAKLLGVDAVLIGKVEWSKPHPLLNQYSSASNPKFALLFLFLVSFYFIKILSRSYGYACKFCFVEENNIPKNTDTNLELNALVVYQDNRRIILIQLKM
jgi:hypothetical protein